MSKDKFRGARRRATLLLALVGGPLTIGAKYCPPLTREMRKLMNKGLIGLRRDRAFGVRHLRRNRIYITDAGRRMVGG